MSAPLPCHAAQIAVRANVDDVRNASAWLELTCRSHNVPKEQIFRLDMCLNEAMANVITHGGPTALASAVNLSLAVKPDSASGEAILSVSDAGKPFNPLLETAKEQAQTLAEAQPGGLGLSMMGLYSDKLGYAFCEGRNHLTVTVRWDAAL